MPRYFFHILDADSQLILDEEGVEFRDYDAAKQEAVAGARDLAAEAVKGGAKVRGLAVVIADETGEVLETIRAKELLG